MKAALFVFALMASSTMAFAQSKKSDAAAAYKQGQALYMKDDYEGAARQFKAAYDLDPDPVYLFNIAQASRLAKLCKEAGEYYRRYLAEAKKAPNADAVNAYIVEVDACAKAQEPVVVVPPPVEQSVAPPVVQEPVRDEEAPRSRKRLVGYIVGGSGVALTGLGFLFMTQVKGFEEDANEVCPSPCVMWDQTKKDKRASIDDKAALREKLMIGSWIAGGAAIAAGVYLIVSGGERGERSVAITPTRNGAMATIRF